MARLNWIEYRRKNRTVWRAEVPLPDGDALAFKLRVSRKDGAEDYRVDFDAGLFGWSMWVTASSFRGAEKNLLEGLHSLFGDFRAALRPFVEVKGMRLADRRILERHFMRDN